MPLSALGRDRAATRDALTGTPNHKLGADYFDHRLDPERETRRLIAKLEALSHQVTLHPVTG